MRKFYIHYPGIACGLEIITIKETKVSCERMTPVSFKTYSHWSKDIIDELGYNSVEEYIRSLRDDKYEEIPENHELWRVGNVH